MSAPVASPEVVESLWSAFPKGRFSGRTSSFSHAQVLFVASIIDSSGIASLIDGWQRDDAEGKRAGGRPRTVSTRTVLILFLLLTVEHSPQLVEELAYLVFNRLAPESLEYLGLDGDAGMSKGLRRTKQQWYFPIWRALQRALKTIDPKPHTTTARGKFPTLAEAQEMKRLWDDDGLREKNRRLKLVSNQLVEATIKLVPEEIEKKWKGDSCIDATVVPAYGSRGAPFGGTHGPNDPSGGWYRRDSQHNVVGAGEKKIVKKSVFGWDVTIVVQVNHDPTALPEFPMLIAGLGIDVPATHLIQTATEIYSDMSRRGHPAGRITGDRGYGPGAKAEDFQIPVRKLGHTLVMDYKSKQLGWTATERDPESEENTGYAGAIQVEGSWYCPSMPENLIEATRLMRNGDIDHKTWRLRITERRAYMLRAKEKPDAEGRTPMICPAKGPGATARCPLADACSTTGEASTPGDKAVTISNPPDADRADAICTNKSSVSFPVTAGAKLAQDIQYGSEEWHRTYSTDRNGIEGINGYLKDSSHEALGDAGNRRIRGMAGQFLLISMLAVSANLRKIQAFRDEELQSATPIERDVARSRKASVRNNRRSRSDRLAPWGDYLRTTPEQDKSDEAAPRKPEEPPTKPRTPKRRPPEKP
jgi:hypothetical protein